MSLHPIRLLPSFREKIWGATALEPWFRPTGALIGEVWFTADDNRTEDGRTLSDLMHGERFPILVKFIFTTARLSLQVHPNDAQAEGGPGKTEMWYILRAEPDSTLALGFNQTITRERLRESALSGEIEQLVRWFPVRAGDTFFTPAGVVHAIGAGIALVEIQQNSDTTYRLYDYGRPRELHLDKGVAVAHLDPHPGPSKPVDLGGGRRELARCDYFVTEALEWDHAQTWQPAPSHLDVLVFLEGKGSIEGRPIGPAEVWLVPAGAEPFPVAVDTPLRLLRTYVPGGGL
jgi:mannose-6-phosphate isomerase